MKQSILTANGSASLISRMNDLQTTSSATWGTMTVTEMLHHCNEAMKATLEGEPKVYPATIKQTALRFLFLHVISKFPKNVSAPKRLQVAGSVSADRFLAEKQTFTDYVNKFKTLSKTIETSHPIFGKLNNKQWGVFTWMHLDHHLRQFGK